MTSEVTAKVSPIVIESQGGLGNQLFQYALGRELAFSLGRDLVIDPWRHDLPRARRFELDRVVVNTTILRSWANGGRGPDVIGKRVPIARLLRSKFRARSGEVKERSFRFDPEILTEKKLERLSGYFQSWRYFPNVAGLLRSELMDPCATAAWVAAAESDLKCSGPWVAIHVRRGDYSTPKGRARHGLLGPDYYQAAWKHIIKILPHALPVIFSDEPDLASDLVGSVIPNTRVLEPPVGALSIDSIRLMSRADAVITANSTFSWWGAWLGDKQLRPVVVPRQWFAEPSLDATDLVLPSWHTSESSGIPII